VHSWQCDIAMSGKLPAAGAASRAAWAVAVGQVGSAAARSSVKRVRLAPVSYSTTGKPAATAGAASATAGYQTWVGKVRARAASVKVRARVPGG
jgi:hypothetical protein